MRSARTKPSDCVVASKASTHARAGVPELVLTTPEIEPPRASVSSIPVADAAWATVTGVPDCGLAFCLYQRLPYVW